MNYANEMSLVTMIYIPNFIKIVSGILKLMGGGDTQTAWRSHKHTPVFQNKESRVKMFI
jgi:hypothetical protein